MTADAPSLVQTPEADRLPRPRGKALLEVIRTLSVAAPLAALALVIFLRNGGTRAEWLGLVLAVGLSVALALRQRAVMRTKLRTASSVLSAFRDGDFAVRARKSASDPLLQDILDAVNQLGDALREERLQGTEVWGLLRKVLAEVDVAVLAFNEAGKILLANDAAASAIARDSNRMIGSSAHDLGLEALLTGEVPRVVERCDPLKGGTWELRRGEFRLFGHVHVLVVLSDLTRPLREREQDAWRRLVRVVGHEINNSLAPIQSVAENLAGLLARTPRPEDWESDVSSGLRVVARRAQSLGRFIAGYAELARLPPPRPEPVQVHEWVTRTAALEQRLPIRIERGPALAVLGDADQLDQLLINLLKNAVEATLERTPNGQVSVRWSLERGMVNVVVRDEGHGVPDSANLFVPFFTTKPSGSGIGLAFARQIAEAHGGGVWLASRIDGAGAEATVRLRCASGD